MLDKDLLKKTISGNIISNLIHNKRFTQAQVAKDLDESEQVVSNYAKGKRFISAEFASKWERKYGDKLIDMIEKALNKSTNDDTNITPEQKLSDNKEISTPDADEVMRQIMARKGEYILINKELILEKYRLVSVEQYEEEKRENDRKYEEALRKHEETKKELESRKSQIDGLYKLMNDMLRKIPDSSGQVTGLQGQQ